MTNPASTLVCRSMCAAACAYAIDPDTTVFTPPQPYYDAAGYLKTPVAISGGDCNINAVLVGTTGDGVVVACRGTLPPAADLPSILDWIQDIFFAEPESIPGLPGKVHTGFYSAIQSIWQRLLAEVTNQLDAAGPGTSLYVTGHSKGGGMASILAMLLNNQSHMLTPRVYTYASPRPGDADFVKVYDATISQQSYENYLDLVPFLPPANKTIKLFAEIPLIGNLFTKAEGWDYTSAGNRLYIKENGKVVADSSFLDDVRIAEIGAKFVEGNYEQVIQAHCHLCKASDCAGGYMQGACQGHVCGN